MGCPDKFSARFELPVQEDQVLLTRTHPFIEGLANYVIDTALDPQLEGAPAAVWSHQDSLRQDPDHPAVGPIPVPHHDIASRER